MRAEPGRPTLCSGLGTCGGSGGPSVTPGQTTEEACSPNRTDSVRTGLELAQGQTKQMLPAMLSPRIPRNMTCSTAPVGWAGNAHGARRLLRADPS